MTEWPLGNIHLFTLDSADATLQFGRIGGEVARPGIVFCLNGELGAGKTTLASGIAQGLGLDAVTQSPTFTLVAEYLNGRLPMYHMDLYRLAEQASLEIDLFEEYLYGDGVCVVEWAQWIQDFLPDVRLELTIHKLDKPDVREIQVISYGKLAMDVLKEWIDRWSSWQWIQQQTN